MMKLLLKTILILALLGALAACQAPAQAPDATQPVDPTAAGAGSATDYPVVPEVNVQVPSADYPAPGNTTQGTNADYPPPAAGVPVLENLSSVKATLVERGSDPQVPGFDRLTVTLLESAAAQGMPSRTDDLIGEQVYFYAEPASLPDLQPGDTFTAEVAYRGDESGGHFYASNIQKQ